MEDKVFKMRWADTVLWAHSFGDEQKSWVNSPQRLELMGEYGA